MNSLQIEHALRRVEGFAGVYPSDCLPQFVHHNSFYVVNFDPSSLPGSHWVAVDFKNGVYFDSYGLPPLVPSIAKFIRRNCTFWTFNKTQLQDDESAVCGQYVCMFVHQTSRGVSLKQFVDQFNRGRRPDTLVVSMFRRTFGPLCGTRGGQRCGPRL